MRGARSGARLSAALVVIGIAMTVLTAARGGGVGLLAQAAVRPRAGAALYLQLRR